MPELAPRFNEQDASPMECRVHARLLDRLAKQLLLARDRGHLEPKDALLALRLCQSLRGRAGDLNRMAALKERPPINQVAT